MEPEIKSHKRLLVLAVVFFAASLVLASTSIPRPKATSQSAAVVLRPATLEPILSAHAYFIKLIGQGESLARRREWKRLAPASLTKILTSAIALYGLPADAQIKISGDGSQDPEEKVSGVPDGEMFLRDDAVRLSMVMSANDAARGIALEVERRCACAFAAVTQAWVDSLGLENSHFKNPTGLDEEGHYSSAEDLARLAEYLWLYHPEVWELSRSVEVTVQSVSGGVYKIQNTDILLKEYPAISGTKTGFTDNAKGALLFFYPVRPRHLAVVVLLGSEDRFGDGRKVIEWLENL